MASQIANKKVYVSNIPKTVNAHCLRAHFQQFGPVAKAVIFEAKMDKTLSGFVSFCDRRSYETSLKASHELEGRQLVVYTVNSHKEKDRMNLADLSPEEQDNLYLFVQDIPKDANKRVLVEYFRKFGTLKSAKLVHPKGKNKSYVYFQYVSMDAAAQTKSIKHKVKDLSCESVTLVCKTGIFKNAKQRNSMEVGEDLLPLLEGPSVHLQLPRDTLQTGVGSRRGINTTSSLSTYFASRSPKVTRSGCSETLLSFNQVSKVDRNKTKSTLAKVLEKSHSLNHSNLHVRFNVQAPTCSEVFFQSNNHL